MNIEERFYCSRCMRELEDEMVCPYCGYDSQKMNQKNFLEEGTLFQNGRYQIGAVLGSGGFGIAYAAWDYNLSQPVAIKEYYPREICDRDVTYMDTVTVEKDEEKKFQFGLMRFIKEAKILSVFENLKPVVSILEWFEENNTAYIVMEFVRGVTLGEYVQMNKLAPQKLIEKMRELVDALILVHGQGIIHRDISPSNIMVQEDGSLKLLDFGAAILEEQQAEGQRKTEIFNRDFAPMEQFEAETAQGPWTDVYALSATLYYLICGELPGRSAKTISSRKIPLKKYQEKAIMGGLIPQPEKRIQTMEIFRSVLYHLPMPEEVIRRRKILVRTISAAAVTSVISILATMNATSGFYLGDGMRFSLQRDGFHVRSFTGEQESLVIPKSKLGIRVSEIETAAFQGAENLAALKIPGTVTTIHDFAFHDCESLTTVVLDEGIEVLGSQVFGNCENLQAVSIPDSLWSMQEDSFDSLAQRLVLLGNLDSPAADLALEYEICFAQVETEENKNGLTLLSYDTKQKEVRIPDELYGERITRIDSGKEKQSVFPTTVKKVLLPQNLQVLGDYAFYKTAIEEINFPETLEIIGDYAFSESSVNTIHLPDCVKELGESSFSVCIKLEEVILSKGMKQIPEGCFETDSSLKKVTIPDNITEIKNLAFSQCISLEKISLPSKIEVIDSNSFMDCTSLVSVYLPGSLEYVNISAFSGCPNTLTFVGYHDSFAEKFAEKYGYHFYAMDDYDQNLLVSPTGNLIVEEEIAYKEKIELPSFFYENVVTGVSDASNLKSKVVKLPEKTEKIEVKSFYDNAYLEEIFFPDTLKWIEGGAFFKCDRLKHVELSEGLEKIGNVAFASCTSLETVSLPDSVRNIKEGAFEKCGNLKEVTVPSSLSLLDSDVFAETGITSVTIPGNVAKCRTAFYGCKDLKEVIIEEGVRTLWGTFAECENLETVIIPKSMNQISCSTFLGCRSLKDVWIYSDDVQLNFVWKATKHVDYQKMEQSHLVADQVFIEKDGIRLFSDSPDLVIHGYRGSTAHSFSMKYGIPFEIIDKPEKRIGDESTENVFAEEIERSEEKNIAEKTFRRYSEEELREKLTPVAGSGCDFLWPQFQYALGYGLMDIAEQCLDAYEKEGQKYDVLAAETAKRFINQSSETGYSEGEVICYFENFEDHPVLCAGDVIVEVNGERITYGQDLSSLKGKSKNDIWTFTILRMDDNQQFSCKEVTVRKEDPLIGTRSIVSMYFEECLG